MPHIRAAAGGAVAGEAEAGSCPTAPPVVFLEVPTNCWTTPHQVMATLVLSQRFPAGQPDTFGGRNGCWPNRSRSCQLRSTVERSKPSALAPLTTSSTGVLALAPMAASDRKAGRLAIAETTARTSPLDPKAA